MTMSSMAQEKSVPRGQWRLTLLILLAAAPVVVAMVMYFANIGVPQARTNKGELMIPVITPEASQIEFSPSEQDLLRQTDGHQRWVLLLVGGSAPVCDARCVEARYLIRQVNVALGKEADRVAHLWLQPLIQESEPAVAKGDRDRVEDPALLRKRIELAPLFDEAKARGLPLNPWDILIMDPIGNIMMHYGPAHTGHDMLDDLKRLLRVSKIG